MIMRRREFLHMAVTVPPLAWLNSLQAPVQIGLELYTVRDPLMLDLLGTLRTVARMGYKVVEFYAPYLQWTGVVTRAVRQCLDDEGLVCLSTHNPRSSFAGDALTRAIRLNETLGSRTMVMVDAPGITTLDGWKVLGDEITVAAATLRSAGMTAGYHNHQVEWTAVSGQRPMDVIAGNTPADVVLQLDVGTCVEMGDDPVTWIRSHPGRIRSIHLKDWGAGQSRGYDVAFGDGDSPWRSIFAAAETVGGAEYYLIEQPTAPLERQLAMAKTCLENYRALRGS
jgi:sugar phosphate isomerase/epimerase